MNIQFDYMVLEILEELNDALDSLAEDAGLSHSAHASTQDRLERARDTLEKRQKNWRTLRQHADAIRREMNEL